MQIMTNITGNAGLVLLFRLIPCWVGSRHDRLQVHCVEPGRMRDGDIAQVVVEQDFRVRLIISSRSFISKGFALRQVHPLRGLSMKKRGYFLLFFCGFSRALCQCRRCEGNSFEKVTAIPPQVLQQGCKSGPELTLGVALVFDGNGISARKAATACLSMTGDGLIHL